MWFKLSLERDKRVRSDLDGLPTTIAFHVTDNFSRASDPDLMDFFEEFREEASGGQTWALLR